MKFATLRLLAFGPFQETTLDLQRDGFHLIYGPNEAGKSSALRAIRQTLYGMDRISQDAFRHTTAALRLGALLQRRDGRTLEFVRRKADKNSLRQADDQTPLAEDALADWLAGIDEEKFELMFGIDHTRLRAGGAEIVRGQGKLAETLFAAAGGVVHLQKIQSELSKGYEALYIPKGRNQTITKKRSELEAARKSLLGMQLPSEEWRRCRDDLTDKDRQRETLLRLLLEQKQQHAKLTRYHTAVPILSRWKQAQQGLANEPAAPALPPDCRSRFEKHQQDRELQSRLAIEAQAALDKLTADLQDAPEFTAVLREENTLTALQKQFGSHLKAKQDRTGLVAGLEAARAAVEQQRQSLRDAESPAEIAALRLAPDRKVRIQELGAEQQARMQQWQSRLADRGKLERRLTELQSQQAEGPEVADHAVLRKIVDRVRSFGDVAAQVDELATAITAEQDAITARLQRLKFWQGPLESFATIAVPAEETIDRFEAERKELEAARKAEIRRQKELTDELATAEEQLRMLESQGAIPSEEGLHAARQERDARWQKIDTACDAGTLPPRTERDAFALSVQDADQHADRLRLAADRVAQKSGLMAEREKAAARVAECQSHLAEIDQGLEQSKQAWHAEWSALPSPPGTPAEMRRWQQERTAILDALTALRSQRAKCDERRELALRLKQELDAAMASATPSPTLAFSLTQAEAQLEQNERQRQQRALWKSSLEATERELAEATIEADGAERAITAWRAAWKDAIAPLGLSVEASSAEAFAVLQAIDDVVQEQQSADQFAQRIQAIDRDAEQFTAAVNDITLRLCPEHHAQSVEAQMTALSALWDDARSRRDQRLALQKELDRQRNHLEKARAAQTVADVALDTLCDQAGGVDRTELASTIERAERRRALQDSISALEEQLVPLAAGATLAEFAASMTTIEPDALRGQIESLALEQQRTEAALSEVDQAIGTARAALQAMQGRGNAAEQNDLCQSLIADVQEATRQYAVLRLAAAVLQRGIERYRDRHQGPLLARASDLFTKLTAGSFSGLRPDMNDKSEPILVGVRPDGRTTVEVTGMSDGACDQMYLALRLAGLEAWLDHHEPLPFIVDDVLLNFDDVRSTAALKVLGEFSRRTQVLFFTHHDRLKELAVEHLSPELLTVHELQSRTIP